VKKGFSAWCLAMLFGAAAPLGYAFDYVWLEAESGAEYSPIVVKSAPKASQRIYLAPWKHGDYAMRHADNGIIEFEVEVQEAGDYALWARAQFPLNNVKPYDIALGEANVSEQSKWLPWNTINLPQDQLNTWLWQPSGTTLTLQAGKNTVTLLQTSCGPGLKLDKIFMTNDLSYVPQGAGEEEKSVTNPSPYTSDIVAKNGQLQVIGSQLSNQAGDAIQLKGISTHGLQWFPLIKNETIPRATEFFNSDVIRLAMYIEDYSPSDPSDYWGGYMAGAEEMERLTRAAIDDAIEAGVYVIVDWHIHDMPNKYTAEAKAFFERISKDYGQHPNIIYEIANEPVAAAHWDSVIYPYATEIVETIRANDPDGVIIVGTPHWSQNVDEAARNQLPYPNIMYAMHFYAGSHDFNTMKNKVETALNSGAAVMVSEWGTSDVGSSFSNFEVAEKWLNFMNERQISWVNWSLGNKDESSSLLKPTASMAGPWTDNDLSDSGKWIKSALAKTHKPQSSPPKANNITAEVAVGQPKEISLEGSDVDGKISHYTLVSAPTSGSVKMQNSTAVYTPPMGFSGADTFTYKATDNEGLASNIATVTINVHAAVTTVAPTATPTPIVSQVPVVTLVPTPVTTTTPTPATSGLECEIVSVDRWYNGYVATAVVKNTGSEPSKAWQVNLDINPQDKIVTRWSVDIQSANDSFIGKNVHYNASIYPGQSITFGFLANYREGKFIAPTCSF